MHVISLNPLNSPWDWKDPTYLHLTIGPGTQLPWLEIQHSFNL